MYVSSYSIKFLSDICCTGALQVEGYYRYLLVWGESSRIVIINSIIIYNKYKIDYVINHIVYQFSFLQFNDLLLICGELLLGNYKLKAELTIDGLEVIKS